MLTEHNFYCLIILAIPIWASPSLRAECNRNVAIIAIELDNINKVISNANMIRESYLQASVSMHSKPPFIKNKAQV